MKNYGNPGSIGQGSEYSVESVNQKILDLIYELVVQSSILIFFCLCKRANNFYLSCTTCGFLISILSGGMGLSGKNNFK